MTHADWHAAMLAEPTDDLVRLAFADWLEDHGEGDRAAWVRLSLDLARMPDVDPGWSTQYHLTLQALERSRPGYWKALPRIWAGGDRGLIDFSAGTWSDARRLGGTRWLPRAAADGWVGVVRFQLRARGSTTIAGLPTAWAKRAAGLALGVHLNGSGLGPDDVTAVLMLRDLYELHADAVLLTADASALLGGHAGVRCLGLRFDDAPEDAMTDAIARMPSLRELTVFGHNARPAAADMIALTANPGLRRLRHLFYPRAGPETLDILRAARPDLTVEPGG